MAGLEQQNFQTELVEAGSNWRGSLLDSSLVGGRPSITRLQTDTEIEVSRGNLPETFIVGQDTRQRPESTAPLEIRPQHVQQGGLGDCYFLSTLADLANQNPQAIKDMIHKNDDGTYTVTFPGDMAHPVTVALPSESQYNQYAQGPNWVRILELAHRKYSGKWSAEDPGDVGSWKQERGGDPAYAIRLLTGNQAVTELTENRSELHIGNTIRRALKEEKLTVACTSSEIPDRTPDSCVPPTTLVGRHAYSIIGFDAQHNRVILRNPWNTNPDGLNSHNGEFHGVFSMSVSDFQKNFFGLSREK